MKCYNCQTELIWGGDHDCEEHEDHNIVSNLSCPKCEAFVLVYWDKKEGKMKTRKREQVKDFEERRVEREFIDDEGKPYKETVREVTPIKKPKKPEITLDGANYSADELSDKIINYLSENKILKL